eukprot:SAG11_NODE_31544_length_291_cov_0.723958_1_plen_75_part_10
MAASVGGIPQSRRNSDGCVTQGLECPVSLPISFSYGADRGVWAQVRKPSKNEQGVASSALAAGLSQNMNGSGGGG